MASAMELEEKQLSKNQLDSFGINMLSFHAIPIVSIVLVRILPITLLNMITQERMNLSMQ